MKKKFSLIIIAVITLLTVASTAFVANAKLFGPDGRNFGRISNIIDQGFTIDDGNKTDLVLPTKCYTKFVITGNVEDEVLVCKKGVSVKKRCLGNTLSGCVGVEGYEYICTPELLPPHDFVR